MLTGTTWVLGVLIGTSVHIGGGLVTMEFDKGRIYGSDGCNRYVSAYESEGETLRIDANIATTRGACVRSSMMQALAFHDALKAAKRYRREGEQLVFLDHEGETLAVFHLRLGRL